MSRTIYIAICDDEKNFCSKMGKMIEEAAKQLNITVEVDIWFSGEELKKYLSQGNHIDIVFLDIELIKTTGIDLGRYIRQELNNIKMQIVYISSKTNYAMHLFKTQPYDFLVKPISGEDVYETLKGVRQILKEKNQRLEYKKGRDICQIEYDEVIYFRSELHKIIMVTRSGETEFYGKLKTILAQAPSQFFSIHKSYLINSDYVERYTFTSVEMINHEILSISRPYQKIVREQLSHRRKS